MKPPFTQEVVREDWPELFLVPSPPTRLWVRGPDAESVSRVLRNLPGRGLAIVGARDATIRSRRQVERVVGELGADSGLVILSGLARGIDAVAHEAAIEHGLATVAVLAHGIDLVYPREHAPLAERILKSGGILITEFPPGVDARKHQFLQRNRLIAGWSRATWVAQAKHRSGALNTAAWAREQVRTVFSTPCYPNDNEMAGNQILLDRDHALPLWGAHSLGAEWLELAAPRARATPPPELGEDRAFARKVLARIERDGELPIELALAWALEDGLSAADFFDELEAMKSRRLITVGPDLLTRQN